MSRYTIQGVLSADVANGGTFTVAFPTGTNKGDFIGGVKAGLTMAQKDLVNFHQFVAVATSLFTITNRSGATWPAGSAWVFSPDLPGERDIRDDDGKNPIKRAYGLRVVGVNLGAPIAADPDGICTSQSRVGAGALTINGAALVSGRCILDVPRNITIDSGGADTAVITVTGKDEYGVTIVENITLNGTTEVAGKKAFKEIPAGASDATITNGAFVGFGDVLGLPLFLEDADYVIKELEDMAAAVAGTFVAGVTSKATATTGDVRGTYDPNSACDGSKCFRLWIVSADPAFYGTTQYGG
jgi:hypothetical protein